MCLSDFYRCADIPFPAVSSSLSPTSGFFRFGSDVVCYGQSSGETRSRSTESLFDASQHVQRNGHRLVLPFDPTQVIDNLRYESYVASGNRLLEKAGLRISIPFASLMPVSSENICRESTCGLGANRVSRLATGSNRGYPS
jgi:hypothetical protein